MNLNFAGVINALGPGGVARIANAQRPPSNYLFNTFLPERLVANYYVDATNMVVRSTMAGLAAMDSPYPPGGQMSVERFMESIAKLAVSNNMTEENIRQLQTLMRQMSYEGTLSNRFLLDEALNFNQKLNIQPLMDRAEWMRGQVLNTGLLNWTHNQKALAIDYGVPASHKLPLRTDAGDTSYSSNPGSLFWQDATTAQELLGYNLRAVIMNSRTFNKIATNEANNIEFVSQSLNVVRIARNVNRGGNTVRDSDSRYWLTVTLYDEEAEIINTTAGAGFGKTEIAKFQPGGKVLYIGANTANGYRVGQGSTGSPRNDLELGYHHVGPTLEGGGSPGRWARLYVPEGFPMNLRGEAASNELPVLLNGDKLVIATTEMLP